MVDKKNIDRLYQEKFKDFEATPRELVWNSISSRLKEKERNKRVLPLWYKFAGVAAVLAFFFNIANNIFKSNTSINTGVAATELDTNFGNLDLTSAEYSQNMMRSSIILQALRADTQKKEINENFIAEAKKQALANPAFAGVIELPEVIIYSRPVFKLSNSNNIVADESIEERKTGKNKNLRDLPVTTSTDDDITKDITSKPAKRLRVSTVAAPIYFDNLGSGSAIDARFANNEGGGEISMSYGINFAYQLTEKVKIRSGISKVDLSYNTRNIAFTAAVNPTALSGIAYNGDVPNYRIENGAVRQYSNISASSEFNRASLASPATGFLNQRLGFIEVPVEIEYVIVDKKIGLNIIGGGSTLFLDENMISLNSANFSTNLGQANNLNTVSFSTNIGVGVDYKISPQFQVNLEPIFKYQINTYNSSTSLNPYYFGIYSGFSFKF